MITANRLADGRVVWRADDGRWVDRAQDACILSGDALSEALAGAIQDERRQLVVGAYATDVMAGSLAPVPALLRERIRADGPSIVFGPPGSGNGD